MRKFAFLCGPSAAVTHELQKKPFPIVNSTQKPHRTQGSTLPWVIVALGFFAFTINELELIDSHRKPSLFSPTKRIAASPLLEHPETAKDWSKRAF